MWRQDLGLSVPAARSHRKSPEMLTYCGKHFRESVHKDHLLTDGFSKNCNMWFHRVQEVYDVEPPKVVISKHWNKPA